MADSQVPPGEPCPDCLTSEFNRYYYAPALMQTAMPDGLRRKGFKEGIEAFKLEGESYDKPPSERGEINREIKKLRSLK